MAAVLLLILMFGTVLDVLRRAATGRSLYGMIEVAPLLLLGAVMLGYGYAEYTRTHVRTSLVTSRMPLRVRFPLRGVMQVLAAVMMFWISWLTLQRGIDAFTGNDVTPGFVALPTWPSRALIPVGFLFFGLHLLRFGVQDLARWREGATVDPHEPEDLDTAVGSEGVRP
jgi:TRAP-type C4-dicarboxylate transport system permease small subunit